MGRAPPRTTRRLLLPSLLFLPGCELGARFGQLLFRAFAALSIALALAGLVLTLVTCVSRGRQWGAALALGPVAGVAAAIGSSTTQQFSSARSLTNRYVEAGDVLAFIVWPTAAAVVSAAVAWTAMVAFRALPARVPRPIGVALAAGALLAAGVYVYLATTLTLSS